MNYILTVFIAVFFIGTNFSFAQNEMSGKQMKRQATKVDTVFTVEERSKIDIWFNNRVNEMNLSDEVREEYDTTVFTYVYEMSRLNDKDKNYSVDEMHVEFDKLVDKMNADVKQILTKDQYINFLENFGKIARIIYQRFGWED
ncbi:hypothetical protein OS188_11490 [Xanthomarina sp. F1114]|uniref:hypothetical protein n=1 Tax=Xanthomarina sp. F1114 TaxID=2996019 RepID=UPI00225DDE17|nr:hypothetical protein [Xanthomarina sp. F1114]MCX7548573.1 hypothetical protein [Xanthomarina sp. F1114]